MMVIERKPVHGDFGVGSYGYCERQKLRVDKRGLEYPYDEVIVLTGTNVVSRFFDECFNRFKKTVV